MWMLRYVFLLANQAFSLFCRSTVRPMAQALVFWVSEASNCFSSTGLQLHGTVNIDHILFPKRKTHRGHTVYTWTKERRFEAHQALHFVTLFTFFDFLTNSYLLWYSVRSHRHLCRFLCCCCCRRRSNQFPLCQCDLLQNAVYQLKTEPNRIISNRNEGLCKTQKQLVISYLIDEYHPTLRNRFILLIRLVPHK